MCQFLFAVVVLCCAIRVRLWILIQLPVVWKCARGCVIARDPCRSLGENLVNSRSMSINHRVLSCVDAKTMHLVYCTWYVCQGAFHVNCTPEIRQRYADSNYNYIVIFVSPRRRSPATRSTWNADWYACRDVLIDHNCMGIVMLLEIRIRFYVGWRLTTFTDSK